VTKPISSAGRIGGVRRAGGRRSSDASPAGEAGRPESAAPASQASSDRLEPPLAISAQILGQSGAAETAAPAKIADKARTAYLDVEWSGGADRRNRLGRIAKTKI
jgi:hypothetical protein